MTDLLTAAQMRAIEQSAIDAGEVTGLELMERAGRGVVEAIFEEWPEFGELNGFFARFLPRRTKRAVILCGPGNNGGDGIVVARLLRERRWDVVVFLHGDPVRLPPDAKTNLERWQSVGPCLPFPEGAERERLLHDPHPDIWMDAVFGIGQTRPLPEPVTQMLHRVYYEQNWCGAPVVAIDFPTGLDSDTGKSVQTFHLAADLTVTFHARKIGHVEGDGPIRCGKVVVADIGLGDNS